MSFSKKDRNFRNTDGNNFPDGAGPGDVEATFAEIVATALHADFGSSPTKIKNVARLTGANERSVRNWLYARNGPSGEALVVLMRHSDAVLRAVLTLAHRDELVRAAGIVAAKAQLRAFATTLDDLLNDDSS